jgi:hypothetical protein
MPHLMLAQRMFLLLLILIVSSTWSLVAREKKEGLKVSGFVGTSTTSAASGVNVVLIDKASARPVDSVSTGIFGKYTFKNVSPGTYIIKAQKVLREVTVVQRDIRMDIDLSAPGRMMDFMKGAMQQQRQLRHPGQPAKWNHHVQLQGWQESPGAIPVHGRARLL